LFSGQLQTCVYVLLKDSTLNHEWRFELFRIRSEHRIAVCHYPPAAGVPGQKEQAPPEGPEPVYAGTGVGAFELRATNSSTAFKLFPAYVKFFHYLFRGQAGFKVPEYRCNRHPRVFENPGTALLCRGCFPQRGIVTNRELPCEPPSFQDKLFTSTL
jgi:hypothetical protein